MYQIVGFRYIFCFLFLKLKDRALLSMLRKKENEIIIIFHIYRENIAKAKGK